MRRLELLIKDAREQTDNVEHDSMEGLSDSQMVSFANNGQSDLLSAIHRQFPAAMVKEQSITLVNEQEAYDLPFDCYLGERVVNVEFSKTGLDRDFYKLKQGTISERFSGYSADPSFYILRNKQLLLQPKPRQGVIRVSYQKALPKLDVSLGKVESATFGSGILSALTLDLSSLKENAASILTDERYLCVVDKDGAIKMRGVAIDYVDDTTGVVTLNGGSHTAESGESIAAGDYVVRGEYSTTHSQLPDVAEEYLLQYLMFRILKRDSSNDSAEQAKEVMQMRDEIVQSFAIPDADPSFVTILDSEFLDSNDGAWY